MIHNSTFRLSRPYRAVLLLLCVFLLALTPLFTKTTFAVNDYIENISFYESGGYIMFSFKVKTSFINKGGGDYWSTIELQTPAGYKYWWYYPYIEGGGQITYTAGNTYSNYIFSTPFLQAPTYIVKQSADWGTFTSAHYITAIRNSATWNENYMAILPHFEDTEDYYFSEEPTLTITFPENNDEITGAFNIVGSYTIPEESNYTQLWAYLREETIYYLNWFIQDLATKSGAVNIRVAGIPLGNYDFVFYFKGGGEPPYYAGSLNNIQILADIPYELPYTGETPPESFSPLDPDIFYIEHSNYATPTPLYTNLTGSLKAIVFTLGDNLTFFSSQFTQENAKNTGQKVGNGVLLVRAYAGNLNSFFSDLPISEVLFLYLILLVIVSVFRIIRQLIMLIKPL